LARHVIQTSENAVGLLVAKSPVELGFLHRAFQEYLAACGSSTISYSALSQKVEEHCQDYQWHEVILALLTLTPRTDDVDDLLKRIWAKRSTATTIDRYAIEHLLYEATLVHSKCSIEFGNMVALDAFKAVELESWKPHRLGVIRIVLEALRQPRFRGTITKRLRSWYPAREWHRTGLFNGMASWARAKEVIECLERGLHDQEAFNQRAAANALAKVSDGDFETGEKVALLSRTTEIPSSRAAAIEALIKGWPDHRHLEAILAAAAQSPSPEVRAISIYGKVKKGIHHADDLNRLLRFGMRSSGLHYSWTEIVYEGIKLGWPGSLEVKNLALRSLERHVYGEHVLESEMALRLLLEGYPNDKELANYCVNEIEREKYPFLAAGLRADVWRLLAKNFRDHPDIVAAIDQWIPEQKYSELQVSAAALVGRTGIAKTKLLALHKSDVPFWFAESLLDGWGMSDPQVSELLTGMSYGSAAKASQIGHLLPSIIIDSQKCRRRLLDVLKDPSCERPDFVLRGLQILGNTQGDSEAIEIILERLNTEMKLLYRHGAMSSIFMSYSRDSRVRDLALKELDFHEGQYGAVAMAYKDDQEIKSKVMEMACPLPSFLRRQIVDSVARGLGDEQLEGSLLGTYDLEFDENLKVESSIAFHRIVKRRYPLPSELLDDLKKTLFCLGFDYQQRRQAAFCGLVLLGESKYIRSAKEPWEGGGSFSVPIRSRGNVAIPFVRFLLENWKDCKPILFDGISETEEAELTNVWEELCLLAYDYETPRMDAFQFLENRSHKTAGPNILRFVARGKPRSKLLLDYCIDALIIRDHVQYGNSDKRMAAELLADHFGGDGEVKKLLSKITLSPYLNSYVLMALCEGWPDSEEITNAVRLIRERQEEASAISLFSIVCARGSSDKVLKLIVDQLAMVSPMYERRMQVFVRPVIRRLQKDPHLLDLLTEHLFSTPTPSEKASISRLIAACHGVSKDLRNWCLDELREQLRDEAIPDLGIDMFEGELRPVKYSLLDVLAER
jgi:hypothetical protein